jgi:hypothetical protein
MMQEERSLLEVLDNSLRRDEVRVQIYPVVERVREELARNKAALMTWEPIPLSIYGVALPSPIRSSWIFVLRAGATTGAERHPNSHQRMISFQGRGDLQTGGEGCWESNLLVSAQNVDLERRWISIPRNVWHQVIVPFIEDWVVVSFHTVRAEELIEERPDVADKRLTKQMRYLTPNNRRGTSRATSGLKGRKGAHGFASARHDRSR